MEKEFVPYEQALALKELGFNEHCFKVYDTMGFLQEESVMNTCEIECDCVLERYSAPLYQQAFRWFREKHRLISSVDIAEEGTAQEHYFVTISTQGSYGSFKTYDEAESECLKQLIEIVKNK